MIRSFTEIPSTRTLFFVLSSAFLTAVAQTPQRVHSASGLTVEGKTFFVLGGNNGTGTIDQFWSLDLTKPTWYTMDPPWTRLQSLSALPAMGIQRATLIRNNTEICYNTIPGFNTASLVTFSSVSNSTPRISKLPDSASTAEGTMAVTDPGTGRIIVPTGYIRPGSYGTLIMDVTRTPATATLGPGMETAIGTSTGATVPHSIRHYAATWSTERKSVLVYGGVDDTPVRNSKLLEYVPGAANWTIVETTGDDPGDRINPCLVPAYQGKILVLFGGQKGLEPLATIYMLDVATKVWTQGKDIPSHLARHKHVCTAAGDSFIAWGGLGQGSDIPETFAAPVVYDLKNDLWSETFALDIVKKQDPALFDPQLPKNTVNDSKSSNVGAIAGGVIGGLVVFLGVGFFLLKRRNQLSATSKREANKLDSEEKAAVGNASSMQSFKNGATVQDIQPQGLNQITSSEDIAETSDTSRLGSPLTTLDPRNPELYPNNPVNSNSLRSPQIILESDQKDQGFDFGPFPELPLAPHAVVVPDMEMTLGGLSDEELDQAVRIQREEVANLELADEIQEARFKLDELLAQQLKRRT